MLVNVGLFLKHPIYVLEETKTNTNIYHLKVGNIYMLLTLTLLVMIPSTFFIASHIGVP